MKIGEGKGKLSSESFPFPSPSPTPFPSKTFVWVNGGHGERIFSFRRRTSPGTAYKKPEAPPPAFSAALPQNMAAPSPRHDEDGAFFVGSASVYGCFISVYDEKRGFFFNFLADGLHDWGILLSIPLEFQEIKHQPLPMAQPFRFGCVIGGIYRYSMMKIRPFSPIYSVGGGYG